MQIMKFKPDYELIKYTFVLIIAAILLILLLKLELTGKALYVIFIPFLLTFIIMSILIELEKIPKFSYLIYIFLLSNMFLLMIGVYFTEGGANIMSIIFEQTNNMSQDELCNNSALLSFKTDGYSFISIGIALMVIAISNTLSLIISIYNNEKIYSIYKKLEVIEKACKSIDNNDDTQSYDRK